ncbi:S8 family peptidase, partial [Micromonospora echinofusca]
RRLRTVTVGAAIVGMVLSTSTANAATPTRQNPPVTAGPTLPVTASPELLRIAANAQAAAPLTLITGDRVHVGLRADGSPVVRRIEPAPRSDGKTVTFHTVTRRGSVHVVPNDALALLGQGLLDWGLFDLAKLAAHVAAGTTGRVPVIVTYTGNVTARTARATPGAATVSTLTSINGQSLTIDGDGRWWNARGTTGTAGAAARATGSLTGVRKVWLNELARISLDTSIAQIGAPTAWQRGYDGSGVTVAVLDTGIDANHPDVAGKIVDQVDFTGNPAGAKDGHGHGTHVAATIAGTGTASGGARKGVAPGARVVVGKVCSDGGSCPTDAIIAGMEWAARSEARIINMSLGSAPTDGTDPMSQALNSLSLSTGRLFVVAAGNAGPNSGTVGAPGAADEALTVAAVDKDDKMAGFSSRGPRLGDDAAKPDISAPGVGIVAARAAGTAMGTVVDEHYTAANGTSMATPHVAGAAAIIAQKHPDLAGNEIKAFLMSTATDLGHDLYAQGVGRVDLVRAVDPTITASGHLNFGRYTYPHTPVSRTLTYTNHTDQPITLTLSRAVSSGGQQPPTGLFTVDADQVTVPAHGTAQVTVGLDGTVLEHGGSYGAYSGVLTARDADGVLRASNRISAFLEPERIPLTVRVVPPADATAVTYGNAVVIPVDDRVNLHDDPVSMPGGERFSTPLFAGTFAAVVAVSWRDARGEEHTATPMAAEVTLTRATTVTLDLRRARPVAVDTPTTTETYHALHRLERTSATGEWSMTVEQEADYGAHDPNWWVLPTTKVRTGTLSHRTSWVRTVPTVTMRVTGGGASFALPVRYPTPDVSVPGGIQAWTEGEKQISRYVRLAVPRLPTSGTSTVVHGGSGTAAELARIDTRGRLLLLTPTDICADVCDFEALRERVAAAAAAGATGVLVAGAPGLRRLGGPSHPTIPCPDGPQSCPAPAPYTALPVVTVPAAEARRLVERLDATSRSGRSVRITLGGSSAPASYVLAFDDTGQVPADLPYRVRPRDLDRVDHRFHAARPGEVTALTWLQWADGQPAPLAANLPHTRTQHTLTTFVSRQRDAINQFGLAWSDHAGPSVLAPARQEIQEVLAGGYRTVRWNTGPTVPGAVPQVRTRSGFTVQTGMLCSGCRQADTFYPNMYLTSSSGARQAMIGLVNNTGVAEYVFGISNCEPTACDLKLSDASGDPLDRRLAPISFRIAAGTPGTVTSGGQQR